MIAKIYFFVALGSFIVGHIFYIVAFWVAPHKTDEPVAPFYLRGNRAVSSRLCPFFFAERNFLGQDLLFW